MQETEQKNSKPDETAEAALNFLKSFGTDITPEVIEAAKKILDSKKGNDPTRLTPIPKKVR